MVTMEIPTKCLLILLLLCVATSAVTAASVKSDSTCQSRECASLAAHMISAMNQSADPCEDFYNFACGNFANAVPYNPAKVRWDDDVDETLYENSYTQLRDRIEKNVFELMMLDRLAVDSDPDIRDLYNLTRLFFRSCTKWMQQSDAGDEAQQLKLSVAFMKGLMKHLMQLIRPTRTDRSVTLEEILAEIVRAGGASLINVRLRTNFELPDKESNSTAVEGFMIDPRSPFWSSESPYENFVQFVTENDIAPSLSLDGFNSTFSDLSKALPDLWNADPEQTAARKCGAERFTSYKSVEQLDAYSKCASPSKPFSWTLFFEKLLQFPIDPKTQIQVAFPAMVIDIVSYFNNQSVFSPDSDQFSPQVSYLIYDWLMSFGDFLPNDLRFNWKAKVHRKYKYSSTNPIQARTTSGKVQDCMQWTKSYMSPIVEHMYRSVHHPKPFDDVENLIQLIKNASIDSARRQTWIKARGQEAIADTIKSIQSRVGLDELTAQQLKGIYNSTIADFRAIEFSGDGLEFSFGSLMSAAQCSRDSKAYAIVNRKLTVPNLMFVRWVNPLDAVPDNDAPTNSIALPIGILQAPGYHAAYPDYINLGGLGFIIGHEIGHLFDYSSHSVTDWCQRWDNETDAAYHGHLECLVRAHGNHTWYKGKPGTSLGFDISDHIGLKAIHGALQMLKRSRGDDAPRLPGLQLNQDQLLFVQVAQKMCSRAEKGASMKKRLPTRMPSHSPASMRVRAMMQSSWEFARAFQCRLAQGMHPSESKCEFW